MNIGIYLQTLAQQDALKEISDAINHNINTPKLKDASIFYDNISYNSFDTKCGLFNSTDLWNFKGKLITTTIATTAKALKIINGIEIYYYYGLEDMVNPLALIGVLSKNIDIISRTKNHSEDLFRKTGYRSSLLCHTFSDIIEKLG